MLLLNGFKAAGQCADIIDLSDRHPDLLVGLNHSQNGQNLVVAIRQNQVTLKEMKWQKNRRPQRSVLVMEKPKSIFSLDRLRQIKLLEALHSMLLCVPRSDSFTYRSIKFGNNVVCVVQVVCAKLKVNNAV